MFLSSGTFSGRRRSLDREPWHCWRWVIFEDERGLFLEQKWNISGYNILELRISGHFWMEMGFLRDEGDTDLLSRWGVSQGPGTAPPVTLVWQEMDLSPIGEAPNAGPRSGRGRPSPRPVLDPPQGGRAPQSSLGAPLRLPAGTDSD